MYHSYMCHSYKPNEAATLLINHIYIHKKVKHSEDNNFWQ